MEIVLNKLRPLIPPIPESCYISFMKRCWDNDPEKRPSALKICETFSEWQNDENVLFKLIEYDKKSRQISNAEWQNEQKILFELTEYNKKIKIIRNYKTNDNFSDEISLDQSSNYNTFQLNSED
ncbi:hypothetical protein C2G38_2088330, partial [Gigaspora rosea]